MKLKLYSILDAKVGAFDSPFTDVRDESAIRRFTDAVNDGSNPNNQWFRHPEDFALYLVGEFITDTAEIIPQKVMKSLVSAASVKKYVPEFSVIPQNGVEKAPVA